MKALFIFLCFSASLNSFGQSEELIDSINKVIGPDYILDVDTLPPYSIYTSFDASDLNADGVKEIIIVATNGDSTEDDDSKEDIDKIFILRRENSQLYIIDTSAAFEVDGRGPRVEVNGKYLTVTHTFHGGFSSLTYQFDSVLNRYILSKLSTSFVVSKYPDQSHVVDLSQEYDVQNQTLTLNSHFYHYDNDKIDRVKNRKIFKKLPSSLKLNLGEMKDPNAYKIFLTQGSVYEQMKKY